MKNQFFTAMKKYLKVCIISLVGIMSLNSCKDDSDEKSELISEVGTWSISDVDYYYDEKILDYKESEIRVWPTSRRGDCFVFVSQSNEGLILNGDGTGKFFGSGEFGTDEYDLTYTKDGKKIRISIVIKGRTVNIEVILENDKLKITHVESDIYGWSPYNSEDVYGADGNGTHTLTIVQFFTKQQ